MPSLEGYALPGSLAPQPAHTQPFPPKQGAPLRHAGAQLEGSHPDFSQDPELCLQVPLYSRVHPATESKRVRVRVPHSVLEAVDGVGEVATEETKTNRKPRSQRGGGSGRGEQGGAPWRKDGKRGGN